MYLALETTVAVLAVFLPVFIGLRSRTNSDWRAMQA